DAQETRERAAVNLVARLRAGGRPHAAWVQVPVVLPGEQTSTRIEPARSLYARVGEVEKLDGVLDSAMLVGYPWADEPRCRASIVVTGDSTETIMAEAADLAARYWAARREFHFVAPTGSIEECVSAGLASGKRPYFISDSGDNPTAGGAGDVSYTVGYLTGVDDIMSGRRTAIYASIADPDSVARCAGGGTVSLQVGGKVDSGPSGPVPLTGDVVFRSPEVAVVRSGGLHVILTARRKPYHRISDFTEIGLDPAEHDLTVVKIGYLEPDLYRAAADWMLALTPGGVDQDLVRVGHQHLQHPIFPFDPDMADPDLTPTLIR
ncbi:MAG TPA: MlrC C-terminal domain-containing protein, partial [Mycobacteriales bacterium]|nr:MlrC C-terminal domain-containing protein [Mycobacteriales bacterium]